MVDFPFAAKIAFVQTAVFRILFVRFHLAFFS